jgi:hypothetical protein
MEKKENTILSKPTENCSAKPLKNKWDKRLDDYANYLKEYITQYKKSLNGNIIALLKYPYMKAKSESIYERLLIAEKKSMLTEKQLKRIGKIQKQIVNPCLN